jgi:ATP citrate lyase citrate-binding
MSSTYFQVGDLGYASELGNYAEYSGAPNEEEVLQYARVVLDVSYFLFFVLILDHSW